MSHSDEARSEDVFQRLKAICVPLLANSLLSQSSTPNVTKLLSELTVALRPIQTGKLLSPSLVSYAFFPLSTILRRNTSSDIPDQVLEKLLIVIAILCESWWWDCDVGVWEQIFMLCGAIIGGIEGKGKGKDRDDETKDAAAQCLWSLLHERTPEEDTLPGINSNRSESRLAQFQDHVRNTNFIPVLGQTFNSLLSTSESHHIPLQRISLRILHVLISLYTPDYFVPSVLPGTVSSMTKIALGMPSGKGWANGEIVEGALMVMQEIIVRSVGDDICAQDGAIHEVHDIEELAALADGPDSQEQATPKPYSTTRTSAWLRGTTSQLHIAMNTLGPLVSHPTPSALFALSKFSSAVLSTTPLTLPQSQPLLLSFLLSLSISEYPTVSTEVRANLLQILSPPSKAHQTLLQTLMQITRNNLSALPRILPSQSDRNVEHIAGLIESVCRLTPDKGEFESASAGLVSITTGIARLLGSTGGIEKWGWGLLSVLEFIPPHTTVSGTSAAQLQLESQVAAVEWAPFPEARLKNVTSRSAHSALDRMFRSLGNAGGDSCLYAIDWFVNIGRNGNGPRAVAALWCACRLLEGVGGLSLDSADGSNSVPKWRSKRVEKFVRGLAKGLAELWDEEMDNETLPNNHTNQDDGSEGHLQVEHITGVPSVRATVNFTPTVTNQHKSHSEPILHKAFALQLLSITAGILQARFTSLLLHTLYPVLHSLVSPVFHLSSTGLAALTFITASTSYTAPSNLLLSNFDYALDAVSRRLSRRWLDIDATKVLVVLVRLVGGDVVQRAGDIVEECFDRLDDFHGYEIIVEGLVEVLGEVVKVIETDEQPTDTPMDSSTAKQAHPRDSERMNAFFDWFVHRHLQQNHDEDETDYGPAPREAWGKGKNKATDEPNEGENIVQQPDPNADPPPTPTQALTKQIVSRSLYFLTHRSPVIRARILTLLSTSVAVLSESALLPSIHHAWPFILNRLADSEPFVVGAAASLIESLASHMGHFMFRRIWDDVWPRFHEMLGKLDLADATSALAVKGYGGVGTESAYTHSHRLYRSLLRTMTAAAKGVRGKDSSVWQVITSFRRFLHSQAHEELQNCARELYVSLSMNNEDAVWLALWSTQGQNGDEMRFMKESKWEINTNVALVFRAMQDSRL